MGDPALSVVIPTYQRRDSVVRLLRSLCTQTSEAADYEVIVSVDGSNDGTERATAELATPYAKDTIWQPNAGRAAACNAGIRRARGEIVLLLDDDMEAEQDLVHAHIQAHEGAVPLGVVGAVPITLDPGAPPVAAFVAQKFNQHLATLAAPGYVFKPNDFYSGNFSIRREDLIRVGGYDEAFTIYGNEDVELFLRLSAAGIRCVFSTRAAARQHYTKGVRALLRDNRAKGRTAVLLAGKHPDAVGQMKVAGYHRGSARWRMAREALLWASDRTAMIPRSVATAAEWAERLWPGRPWLPYGLLVDYFFWLGVRDASRGTGSRVPAPSLTEPNDGAANA